MSTLVQSLSAETRLDLRGLKCPLPVMRAEKALLQMQPGSLLVVECTDPLAAIDLPNLAREMGDIYEGSDAAAGFAIHRIRKAGAPSCG